MPTYDIFLFESKSTLLLLLVSRAQPFAQQMSPPSTDCGIIWDASVQKGWHELSLWVASYQDQVRRDACHHSWCQIIGDWDWDWPTCNCPSL